MKRIFQLNRPVAALVAILATASIAQGASAAECGTRGGVFERIADCSTHPDSRNGDLLLVSRLLDDDSSVARDFWFEPGTKTIWTPPLPYTWIAVSDNFRVAGTFKGIAGTIPFKSVGNGFFGDVVFGAETFCGMRPGGLGNHWYLRNRFAVPVPRGAQYRIPTVADFQAYRRASGADEPDGRGFWTRELGSSRRERLVFRNGEVFSTHARKYGARLMCVADVH